MKSYGVFANYYDRLMFDVDYKKRAEYIGEIFKRHSLSGNSVLDLACGTGAISFELAKLGFDVIGVDASAEMLSKAVEKKKISPQNPLFICQDMCALDLFGTVRAAVCTLDGINHLKGIEAVQKAFNGVSLFLEKDGLFVFDLNSPYKIENTLGNNVFVYDYDDIYCVWQNSYNKKSRVCRFDLTFFERCGDRYVRSDESFSERAYTSVQIKNRLNKAGLCLEAVYDDLSFDAPDEKSPRIIYVARKL